VAAIVILEDLVGFGITIENHRAADRLGGVLIVGNQSVAHQRLDISDDLPARVSVKFSDTMPIKGGTVTNVESDEFMKLIAIETVVGIEGSAFAAELRNFHFGSSFRLKDRSASNCLLP
jgi:hypothetical protein